MQALAPSPTGWCSRHRTVVDRYYCRSCLVCCQIRLLEESLHRRLLKLGDVSTSAGNFRLVINQLRQEQVQLKEVYQTVRTCVVEVVSQPAGACVVWRRSQAGICTQLRDELAEMQGQMDSALEEASAMCEERDKVCTVIDAS